MTSDAERLRKHCGLCGAVPGQPCTVVSGSGQPGDQPGDARLIPHYYRGDDEPRSPLWKDEPAPR